MTITIQSSRLVKPSYMNANAPIASTCDQVRLSAFDNVVDGQHMAIIYAFKRATPPNSAIEKGLSRALAEYREWAGRIAEDAEGNAVVLLNDRGVRFVEATVDTKLKYLLPSKPTKELQSLHPSLNGVEELVQVQLTRFACGSLVVGFTAHHQIADGRATSNFLVAWGLATRGLAIDPVPPLHTRDTLFKPRDPPIVQYDHQKIEYMSRKRYAKTVLDASNDPNEEKIVIQKVYLSNEFITKLCAVASAGVSKPYSRFATVLGHLWRVITKARGLHEHETTQIRIAVDGRARLDKVPSEYFGNLVLWAFPRSKVRDLINRPLSYAVELIRAEVKKVNNNYFKSFIDFASSDIIKKEGLVSSDSVNRRILSPNLEAYSWLTIPFCDFNFGNGSPYYFMPAYFPTEGLLFFLPSQLGDGSMEVIVPLLDDNVDTFKKYCYSLN